MKSITQPQPKLLVPPSFRSFALPSLLTLSPFRPLLQQPSPCPIRLIRPLNNATNGDPTAANLGPPNRTPRPPDGAQVRDSIDVGNAPNATHSCSEGCREHKSARQASLGRSPWEATRPANHTEAAARAASRPPVPARVSTLPATETPRKENNKPNQPNQTKPNHQTNQPTSAQSRRQLTRNTTFGVHRK